MGAAGHGLAGRACPTTPARSRVAPGGTGAALDLSTSLVTGTGQGQAGKWAHGWAWLSGTYGQRLTLLGPCWGRADSPGGDMGSLVVGRVGGASGVLGRESMACEQPQGLGRC